MGHVRQDAASGWSLGPDMTCLPCLRSVCSESTATRAPHVCCCPHPTTITTCRPLQPPIDTPTHSYTPTRSHQHTHHIARQELSGTRTWSSRAGGSCVGAVLPCPCRLCPCLVTCTRAGLSAAPTHLSSRLVWSWRLAFSRPSHSPSALMGPPVHGPSKRLQGRVCLGAW
jgi:hypothetical protein